MALTLALLTLLLTTSSLALQPPIRRDDCSSSSVRSRTSLNTAWRFHRFESNPDNIVYDLRPDHANLTGPLQVLKPWILPSANAFIPDPAAHHQPPSNTTPPAAPSYALPSFDDSSWTELTLPHDWAIAGPFYVGEDVSVTGGMGRLPVQGVGWYRRSLCIDDDDDGKDKTARYYLEIDGAMSYAMVWVNGKLAGGWPYGYNSFRVELTGYLKRDGKEENVIAIRVDNPVQSSRWYPGGGVYRNVWLTKVAGEASVSQWGTFVTTREVGKDSAVVDLVVDVENQAGKRTVEVVTDVYEVDTKTGEKGKKVAQFPKQRVALEGGEEKTVNGSVTIKNPRLWGPWTSQIPNLYVAVSRLYVDNKLVDSYETEFGIRSVIFDSNNGLLVNGERIRIQGVNQHHDLGALGAAFNLRAAERQLQLLRDLGCNAIRMSHNPPAPELLTLTDRMGFFVLNEIFDAWQRPKNPNDFSLLFTDWSEPDLRSFLRRDRNHPSIIAWSVGNEVGEQYTASDGALVARRLVAIAHSEDHTRPVTASMNYAKPDMPFPSEFDLISLNYQGEGIRDAPAYAGLDGIKTAPQYPSFHAAFPQKLILSSETAASLSSRGTYNILPLTNQTSAPVSDTPSGGGDPNTLHVSAYELYTAPFGSSPDKVFSTQDAHYPYVAGEFVWSGWDYLGEPTPYYSARSSYFGIIDLAGFKKDRFFLYQARWRPDLKAAHILPHWTWGEGQVGKVTPVHVFSNADEAELFVNGVSQGRVVKNGSGTSYRFRWDEVVYAPGEVHVVTWKGGKAWANARVQTAGEAVGLRLTADREVISGDGQDLAFVMVEVVDKEGRVVPTADMKLAFSVEGPAEIAATDNGDPADMTSFVSTERKAFNGLALAIVRGKSGARGKVMLKVTGNGVKTAQITLKVQ